MKLLASGVFNRITHLFESPYRKVGIGFVREKILKHTRNNKIKPISVCGFRILYKDDLSFIHSLEEIFFSDIYKSNYDKNKRVKIIDCGTNIGMSILYFKLNNPLAEIEAFEPDKKNYELLNSNLRNWNFNNINISDSAIWINDDEIEFMNTGDLGGKINDSKTKGENISLIKCTRLKRILEEPVDILKMDIEGAEYEVIKDCQENLKNVSNLFLEYHGKFSDNHKLIEIFQIIESAGFKFYVKEAANLYPTPFFRKATTYPYDVQLNIFAFRD
jgi:FkbM family methyltransferase